MNILLYFIAGIIFYILTHNWDQKKAEVFGRTLAGRVSGGLNFSPVDQHRPSWTGVERMKSSFRDHLFHILGGQSLPPLQFIPPRSTFAYSNSRPHLRRGLRRWLSLPSLQMTSNLNHRQSSSLRDTPYTSPCGRVATSTVPEVSPTWTSQVCHYKSSLRF